MRLILAALGLVILACAGADLTTTAIAKAAHDARSAQEWRD